MIFNNLQNQQSVIQLCCHACGVEVEEFMSKSRRAKVIMARQIAYKVFRDEMRLTLKEIGAIVSAKKPKDHSTIHNALEKFDNFMEVDDERTVLAYDHVCRNLRTIMHESKSITIHYNDNFPINKLKSFLIRHKNCVFHAENATFVDVDLQLKSSLM